MVLIFYESNFAYEVYSDGGHEVVGEHVILYVKLEQLTANLRSRDDFPTPELPMRRVLKR